MAVHTRIYASGAITFGGQPAIDDLLAANYSAVLVWSVHVDATGTLFLNDTQIVKGGVYQEATPMNLPSRLAQLRKAGMQILFSVGAGGVTDFQSIGNLLGKGGGVPGQPLYDNFLALKNAMIAGGGDIDAIDFDNEEISQPFPPKPDPVQVKTMVGFGIMLTKIGYASVTFCPYQDIETWTATYNQLRQAPNNVVVSALHLQCYSGGAGNDPSPWGKMIADNGGGTLLIAGLATVQTPDGPWWNKGHPKPPVVPPSRGSSVVMTPNVAMYGQANWSGMLRKGNYASPDDAMAGAIGGETFFFYCRGYLDLGPGKQFQQGDAVFFAGIPWWGSAPQCDGYSLSGGCINMYNDNGACPSDLQTQYARWKQEKYPPDGGFIWLYDSTVNCLLSGCCGGTEQAPATTAKAYREAITNGLS
jgi:hypothetical protein